MSLYIEELLIRLLRVGAGGQKQSGPIEAQSRNEVFLRVDKYLASRLSQTRRWTASAGTIWSAAAGCSRYSTPRRAAA
ncbi:MAG: hypothetical protein ACLUEK_09610 [Oscillospiraceae bacterium]